LWQTDKNSNNTQTAEWLEQRFRLFEQFTLPSVLNQTDKNFKWIVLFSSETPIKYKSRIDEIRSRCPQFRAIGVAPGQSAIFGQIFKEVIENDLGDKAEGIVSTTYLDNDDALSVHYMEMIHNLISTNYNKIIAQTSIINFRFGCQYFTEHKVASKASYKRNHFITLAEPLGSNSIKTVFGYGSHYYIDKHNGINKIINTKPAMWLEVIHDKNVINDVRTSIHTRIIGSEMLLRTFGVTAETNGNTISSFLKLLEMKIRQKIKMLAMR
jgi:hypothetical protein